MYIHANMQGSGTLLLALDGLVVGLVVEADTEQGWLRRYDTRGLRLETRPAPPPVPDQPRVSSLACFDFEAARAHGDEYRRKVAACPIVLAEGAVDFVGDTATDPDWMIAQRMAAIRIKRGLPIDAAHAANAGSATASVLERLAARIRSEAVTVSNLRQFRGSDRLPLPDDTCRYVPTGAYELHVSYASAMETQAHKKAVESWARDNPDLVPLYVNAVSDEKKAP